MDKERYRRGAHHFVWKKKYGHHVLQGDLGTVFSLSGKDGAVSEGKKFLPVAERISPPAKNILGPSFVVTRLFRSDSGCGD